ncbi:MAG: hypothetical protein IID41_16950, partial [Planctomycetes bacterium]|nr:hypothetical protein [Planctomycetota bacterium]
GHSEMYQEVVQQAAQSAAQDIPAMVMGEKVHQASDQNLLLGTCQFAGMLASARWTGDRRWDWGGPGIMELPDSPQV